MFNNNNNNNKSICKAKNIVHRDYSKRYCTLFHFPCGIIILMRYMYMNVCAAV